MDNQLRTEKKIVSFFGWMILLVTFSAFDSRTTLSAQLSLNNSCPITTEFEFYDIAGNNLTEIKEQIYSKGPVDGDGVRRSAYAGWKISWDWPRRADGSEDLESVSVKCSVRILMPRLKSSRGMKWSERVRWMRYLEQTRTHELNHMYQAASHAEVIPEMIRAGVRDGKVKKAADANRIGFKILKSIRERDVLYDVLTNHGKTEGIEL